MQASTASPVDVFEAAPASAPAYSFRNGNDIIFTFTATDAGGAGIDLTDFANDVTLSANNGTTILNALPGSISAVEAAGVVTFTVALEIPTSATIGTYDNTATVADRAGNSSLADLGQFVLGNELHATIELELFAGNQREITFVATNILGGVLSTWTETVSFIGSLGTVSLENVPALTANLSAKTPWNLRRKIAVNFSPTGVASASFTGGNRLLGGDLNQDNVINTFDYSTLRFNWLTTAPESDIDGSGTVDAFDYSMIRNHFYDRGDAQ